MRVLPEGEEEEGGGEMGWGGWDGAGAGKNRTAAAGGKLSKLQAKDGEGDCDRCGTEGR